MIKLQFPDGRTAEVEQGITIAAFAAQSGLARQTAGGILNGKVHDLNYRMMRGGAFRWIEMDSPIADLMRQRTLSFLLITAAGHCLPESQVIVEHTLAHGFYCEINGPSPLSTDQIDQLRERMQVLMDRKEPIYRRVVPKAQAVAHFNRLKMTDKAQLLQQRTSEKCSIYTCDGIDDYFYGVMFPDVSWLEHFALLPYHKGVWLSCRAELKDQPKLFQVFQEFEDRGKRTGIFMVCQLNQKLREGRLKEIVAENEQRIVQDLERLADQIQNRSEVRMILIAGPSSAGKTTFSRRLAEALRKRGRLPLPISMDDFFRDRQDTPRLPDGTFDFENIECLDLPLFNRTLQSLLKGEAAALPTFDFERGIKVWNKAPVQIDERQIIILEGLHALNPRTSEAIAENRKFKIYINALTHLNFDSHNRIATTDYRLIRRMTRDFQFRGRSVAETVATWHHVREGEDRYIYPYQEQADVLFNTSMDYELPVLKTILMPLLEAVDPKCEEYIETNRIGKLLAYFDSADAGCVPSDSILAEFTGGSQYED